MAGAERGKARGRWKERENVLPVESAGKQADGGKGGETYNQCKAREKQATTEKSGKKYD